MSFANPNSYRRRSRHREANRTCYYKLVSFKSDDEQFAIPIEQVQCIIKEFIPQGKLQEGYSLVRHNEDTITLVNLSCIFPNNEPAYHHNYLVVCKLKNGDRIGLPIVDMPIIVEATAEQFEDLPELYRQKFTSKAVVQLINAADGVTLFRLDPEQLI